MWVFEYPGVLLLLLLVPPAIYLRHFWRRRGGRIHYPFRIWRGTGFRPGFSVPRLLYALAAVCLWLGVVLLIVALAGPAEVGRERIFQNRGIDMMIVLDESPSMAAQDFVPDNRFEAARKVIRDFVERRENDAIGLVTFSKEAALRVPMTLDYGRLRERLGSLGIMSLGDGTAIGMGLALAALHLKPGESAQKVIILLTDGENNSGEILPETAADVAAQLGIRVYAIGIGSKEPAPLEFTDPRTGEQYRGTFEQGFNEQLLRQIAGKTGGSYFYAGSTGTLDSVFEAIDSLETVQKRVRIEVTHEGRHRLLLALGLGLILVDFVIRRLLLRELV